MPNKLNTSLLSLTVIFLSLFNSCQESKTINKAITAIPVDVKIDRFDKRFAEATPGTLDALKAEYPFMFADTYDDSFWISRMNDTLQQQLSDEVLNTFPNLNTQKTELELFFQHIKHYYKNFKVPRVITTTSFVDYLNRVIVTDSILLLAVDNYLGKDHKYYADFPKYISKQLSSNNLIIDVATQYGKYFMRKQPHKTLIDEMVYYGKQLYFKDIMLPLKSEAAKIGYTETELNWAKDNESYIWRYFIDRELLYSTDSSLPSRFVTPAPFTKFYLKGIDNESPAQLGAFIGWQIVKSYAEVTGSSLQQVLEKDPEELFNQSQYKPKK